MNNKKYRLQLRKPAYTRQQKSRLQLRKPAYGKTAYGKTSYDEISTLLAKTDQVFVKDQ